MSASHSPASHTQTIHRVEVRPRPECVDVHGSSLLRCTPEQLRPEFPEEGRHRTAKVPATTMAQPVFERMRRAAWWRAPLFSSVISSAIDTGLFFSLAFAGTMVPWQQLALGDYGVKIAMALVLLAPYKALIGVLMRWQASSARHA